MAKPTKPVADLPPPRPGYRPCAGIMLYNARGQVFAGQRIDTTAEAWQMPQGGIDPGETGLEAAWRELGEEVGTDKAELIAASDDWLYYDLPADLQGKLWGGKFLGQAQQWFLLRFTGQDSDINIQTNHPEFRAWQWVEPSHLPELIVPFKRPIYRQVMALFGHKLPVIR
jgi:putative (di)nucleoside polyphosphate hydrolase